MELELDFDIDEALAQARLGGELEAEIEAEAEETEVEQEFQELQAAKAAEEAKAEIDPECPTSIEELEKIERLINKLPLCRKELLAQVEARKQSGSAKSDNEAAKQIAEETGKKPETVRKQIQRAKKEKVGTVSQPKGRPPKYKENSEKVAADNPKADEAKARPQPDYDKYWDVVEFNLEAEIDACDLYDGPPSPADQWKRIKALMKELGKAQGKAQKRAQKA